MAALVIDIAEYRRRKAEAARRAAPPPVPVMMPVFCGYGWVLVPMMMPMPASGRWHA